MSQPEVKAAESAGNLNVEWMSEKHWWPTYIALIVGLRLLILYFAPYLDQAGQWTLTNVSHAVVSNSDSRQERKGNGHRKRWRLIREPVVVSDRQTLERLVRCACFDVQEELVPKSCHIFR